jgi:hypothetical protein
MTYLKEYISIYKEKAISVSDTLKNKNICMLVYKKSDSYRVYLYDKTNILSEYKDSIDLNGMIAYGRIEKEFDTPYKAYNTSYTASLKGYGAFLYDTLLALSGKRGLCPDRGVVSKDAKNVWEFYFTKRYDEIVARPIDDEDNPLTKTTVDDGYVHEPDPLASDLDSRNFIDYVYYFKNPSQYLTDIPKLEKRHEDFINEITYNNFYNDLEISAIDFFIKQKESRVGL